MTTIVKDTSLVGYWHYAQGVNGTTWQNISPNTSGKYNGTINGGVTVQADGLNFDGTSGWVSIGSIAEIANNFNVSIEILFNQPSIAGSTTTLFSHNNGSNRYHAIKSYYASGYGKAIPESLYYNSSSYDLLGGNNGFNATDNLITLTSASGARKLYLNGTLLNSSTTGFYLADTYNAIGAYLSYTNVASNFFKGKIKAVRIYNKTLSGAEVSQNYSVGNSVGLVDTTTVNFDTLQDLYLRYDLKQAIYHSISYQVDSLQHYVDAIPQSSVSEQDSIKIYNALDNSLISADNPIMFNLDISKNESKEQRLYVQSKEGYTLSDVILSFQGEKANKWQLALDVNGSPNIYNDPLNSLSLGTVGGVAGNKVYFWVKSFTDSFDTLGKDQSVLLDVTGNVSIY